MRTMIVDDSAAMRMIVKRTLRQVGYEDLEVVEADDGTTALRKIGECSPDLVLCDWNMPVMDGMTLLRTLRESGNVVPFGFVTTESTAEMRAQASAAGAQFLVAKPFTAESFGAAIEPVLGKASGR